MARDNKLLGHFKLDGIRPARRGEPRIEVSFDIDANGIVHVKAKDLDTNKEQSITIQNSTGLSKDEIDRMVKEAEANREADEKRREEVEIRNKAEQYILQIDRSLEEQGDKIDANQKEQTIKLRDELKKALETNDIETLKSKLEQLEQAAQAMNQYTNSASTSDAESTTRKDDDVVDANFTEK
jgi:molecular chaperone DnaK